MSYLKEKSPSREELFSLIDGLTSRFNFALLWLKPRGKMPISKGWSSAPYASASDLKTEYRDGYNIGVRLGEATTLPDFRCLAVIDCDLKSKDEKHLKEMRDALDALIGPGGVRVFSGRANGSLHVYIRTDMPVRAKCLAASKDKVKVHMGNGSVSKKELELLTSDEIKAGIRIRRAWEICLMGEGQQCVLPPSLHPTSEKRYTFSMPWEDIKLDDFPIVKEEQINLWRKASGFGPVEIVDQSDDQDLKVVEGVVSLIGQGATPRGIPEKWAALIVSGEGAQGDRSAELMRVSLALLRAGFTVQEVLMHLSRPGDYLGATSYEHTKSSDLKTALIWLYKYTVKKAMDEIKRVREFEASPYNESVEAPFPSELDSHVSRSLIQSGNWMAELDRAGGRIDGRPVPSFKNVHSILTHLIGPDFIAYNSFTHDYVYQKATLWGPKIGDRLKEADLLAIKFYLTTQWRFEPPTQTIFDVLIFIGTENSFSPVVNFLNTLKWDGVKRLDSWLVRYLKAEDSAYSRMVGRKTLAAMVARAMTPGCKFDNVLILEGPQGCGKSSAVDILARPWFSDAMVTIGDKDAVMQLQHAWVLEIGELSSMRKADVDQLKQFITQTVDRIRTPYGKVVEALPRHCIFIGTTNSDTYLKDTTGNRRFWPVPVGRLDRDALINDRDQLLAEALHAFQSGEVLYLDDPEVIQAALEMQADRVFQDALVEQLEDFLNHQDHPQIDSTQFKLSELFGDWGPFKSSTPDLYMQHRVGSALRVLGYEKRRRRIEGGEKAVFWERSGPGAGTMDEGGF